MSGALAELRSETIVLLFTDIEGSTKRWERDAAAMSDAVRRHDALMRAVMGAHGGEVFKTVGDAFCVAFRNARAAAGAAIAAQRALDAEDFSAVDGIRVRMAIHAGVVEARDGDYFGPALNRVARLLSTAHGRQTVLSASAAQLVGDALEPGVELQPLGTHALKDLARPETVYGLLAPGLAREFPPLVSPKRALHNLPTAPDPLRGRDAELERVTKLLERDRTITIAGPGGIGKTRLAIAAAATQLERFPDGVWFVDLAALEEETLVTAAFGEPFGLRAEGGRGMPDLIEGLRMRRALLVVDNAEHLVATVAPAVRELLKQCPDLTFLMTSREPLAISGERVVRLGPLRRADAAALFGERAIAFDPEFDPSGSRRALIEEVCERLDDVPYAIELAAARLRTSSLERLRKEFDARFPHLKAVERGTHGRLQTMRATIEWSFGLLDEADQAAFRAAAAFRGSWTVEAFVAVTGVPSEPEDAEDRLASLIDKSLVMTETVETGKRFRFLESTRAFAVELLHATPEAERGVFLRHARWMRTFALEQHGGAGTLSPEGYERLEADIDNFRAVFARGFEDGTVDAAAALEALMAARFYYFDSSRFGELERWLTLALDRVPGPTDATARANAVLAFVQLSTGSVPLEACLARYETALASVDREADPDFVARASIFMGRIEYRLGRSEEALRRFRAAAELAERTDDLPTAMSALNETLWADPGAPVERRRAIVARLFELARRYGDPGWLASISSSAAEVELDAGAVEAGLRFAREATDRAEASGREFALADALEKVARAGVLSGDLALARDACERGLGVAGAGRNPHLAADFFLWRASAEHASGNLEAARNDLAERRAILARAKFVGNYLREAERLERELA